MINSSKEGLGKAVGASDDGKTIYYENQRGDGIVGRPAPKGLDASNFFPKFTGEKPDKPDKEILDDPIVDATRTSKSGEQYKVKLPLSQADPEAFRDMMVRKNAGKKGGLEDALKPKPKAAVATPPAPAAAAPAAAPAGLPGFGSGELYGLTERELQAEARKGNPVAIRKLEAMSYDKPRRGIGGGDWQAGMN
jgi:hypothetical protein